MINTSCSPLLEVQDLSISIPHFNNRVAKDIKILEQVSFALNAGDCLAIIGESGSGKTSISKALLGLCPPQFNISGKAIYHSQNLLNIPTTHACWSNIRGKQIAMIPQNSSNAFNPLLSIGHQVYETIKYKNTLNKNELKQLVEDSFSAVSLSNCQELLSKYPYELSGGVLQRISIALALMLKAEIIIADEPTSNIDWLSKKEVLGFFKHALYQHNQSLLIITHDFADTKELANHIIILKDGKIVEHGTATQVLNNPIHPYTKSLIEARQKLDKQFQHVINPQHHLQG